MTVSTEGLTAASVNYIKTGYPELATLEECVDFVEWSLAETPSAEIDVLRRVGFFPWVEASKEFDQALNQAILCRYKPVFDHLRRALELVLLGAFFTSDASNQLDARKWLEAERESPFFAKTCRALTRISPFSDLESAHNWSKILLEFYWELCDIIHVRGRRASFDEVQPSPLYLGGKGVPHFSEQCLHRVLDYFMATVKHSATIVALTNPVLLVGLPIDEKFGLNSPASGVFNEAESERLFNLLLPDTKPFFRDLREKDCGVRSIVEWVQGMPDLCEEDLRQQVESMREMLKEEAHNTSPQADG